MKFRSPAQRVQDWNSGHFYRSCYLLTYWRHRCLIARLSWHWHRLFYSTVVWTAWPTQSPAMFPLFFSGVRRIEWCPSSAHCSLSISKRAISQLSAGYCQFGSWLVSCVCLSALSVCCLSQTVRAINSLAKWYGAPVISKYAARSAPHCLRRLSVRPSVCEVGGLWSHIGGKGNLGN